MQTLQETNNKWNNAYDAHYKAEQLAIRIKAEMNAILDANTEPVTLTVSGDPERGRSIITPGDLHDFNAGTIIRVGSIEYMRIADARGPWIDCFGHEYTHAEMFRRLLTYSDECSIVCVG